ncbi:MAG: glycosyltransferase family 39 protein [Patescibacteria group bacterium]
MAWLVSIILALSLFLRVSLLNVVPPELFGDEIDVGYQAYSLLKTGKDLYGQILPTYIHSLSEWRAPLLMYATVPTVAAFGSNEWGVRLPSAIFGSLAPIILFLLVTETFKNWKLKIGICASIALAVMPWHVWYSRAAFETVLMLDLTMLGTLLFLKKRFSLGLLFLALAMYTYSTATLFIPLWILFLHFFTRTRPKILSLVLLAVILTPLIFNTISGRASARFELLSVFNSSDIFKNQQLRKDDTFLPIIWHNKFEYSARAFLNNYLRAFSTDFLFIRGDPVFRHSPQVTGQLLPLSAPFVVLGLWYLAKRKQWLWFVWLLLAPLPAALTADGGYHATRLFFMIPPLAVAMGAGFLQLPKSLGYFLLLLLTINFIWVGHYYVVHYPKDASVWWHVGYKDVLTKLANISPDYSRVFINNTYEPSLERFLFWTKYSPALFHKSFIIDKPQAEVVPNYNGFTLDGKYYFGNFSKTDYRSYLIPGSLYLISQRDNVDGDWDWRVSPPDNITVLATSTNLSNQPLFYLITRK